MMVLIDYFKNRVVKLMERFMIRYLSIFFMKPFTRSQFIMLKVA